MLRDESTKLGDGGTNRTVPRPLGFNADGPQGMTFDVLRPEWLPSYRHDSRIQLGEAAIDPERRTVA